MSSKKLNDETFEQMLKHAASDYAEQEGERLQAELALLPEVETTPNFEARVIKALRKAKRPKKLVWLPRLAAACAVLVVGAMLFPTSVIAMRTQFFDFIATQFGNHAVLSRDKLTEQNFTYDLSHIPTDWRYIYVPTKLPNGFASFKLESNPTTVAITYENKTGQEIVFCQSFYNSDTEILLDTEDASFKEIRLNGHPAFVSVKEDASSIVWFTDEFSFTLTTHFLLPEKELIKIASSIKIVDK